MERPKFSPMLAKYAAEDIVAELVKNGLIGADQAEESVADLVKYGRRHMDGYELAKTLDDCGRWDCDFQIAEVLDGWSHAIDHHIRRAEADWAKMTSPQPPLPLGTRVRLSGGESGVLDGIYEHGAAKYLVKIDGEKGDGRRIVNFESVKPFVEAAA